MLLTSYTLIKKKSRLCRRVIILVQMTKMIVVVVFVVRITTFSLHSMPCHMGLFTELLLT